MSTTLRVVLALLLGAAIGIVLAWTSPGAAAQAAAIAQPIGKLWLNALQMTVVPLVAALVVLGVNAAADAAASGRTARRTLLVFVAILAACALFAALVAPNVLSLLPRDPATVDALRQAMGAPATPPKAPAFGDWLSGIVPTNAIAAAAQGAMLPMIVFALFFGFALGRIDAQRKAQLLGLVQGIADTMMVIVHWVLWAAPLGVFALVLAVSAGIGLHMLGALAAYMLMQIGMYLCVALLMYPIARVFGGTSLRRFAVAAAPPQAIAASTQSSLASLPAMLEAARAKLGVPLPVASLTLPMAVSLFRITSPVQYIGVSAFVAWLYGVDIGPAQWAGAIALSVVVSMGSVGLPGQASFMFTNLPVAQSLGLPLDPLAILMAVDTVPDVFATVGNVTGDLAATRVVAQRDAAYGNDVFANEAPPD